jgi:hypothetical protein
MKEVHIRTQGANLVSATARGRQLGRRSIRLALTLLMAGPGAATPLSAAAPTIRESSSFFTGPIYPNQSFWLSGSGLTGTTGVTLNGVPALFEVSSNTAIYIYVPYPETETSLDGSLRILHPNGNWTSSATANVTLSQVQPTQLVSYARLDSGYAVVITGVNLQLVTGITIDGAVAAFSKLYPSASASANLSGTATRLIVPVTSLTAIANKVLSYTVSSGTAPGDVTLAPTTASNLVLLNGIAPGNVGQMDVSQFSSTNYGSYEVRITSAAAVTNTRYADSDPVYGNNFVTAQIDLSGRRLVLGPCRLAVPEKEDRPIGLAAHEIDEAALRFGGADGGELLLEPQVVGGCEIGLRAGERLDALDIHGPGRQACPVEQVRAHLAVGPVGQPPDAERPDDKNGRKQARHQAAAHASQVRDRQVHILSFTI